MPLLLVLIGSRVWGYIWLYMCGVSRWAQGKHPGLSTHLRRGAQFLEVLLVEI